MSTFYPQVMESTNGEFYKSDLLSLDFMKNRSIYIKGVIDDEVANSTISQLRYLASKSEEDIYIIINSPGGSVTDGMAIYDTLKYINCDVVTICIGMAASMGAFLLAAGTKGKRYVLPNAEVMLHQPMGGTQGQATEILIAAKHILKTKEKLNRILAENTGKDYETVCADTERDNWLDAESAAEYGVCDSIGFPPNFF